MTIFFPLVFFNFVLVNPSVWGSKRKIGVSFFVVRLSSTHHVFPDVVFPLMSRNG